MTLKEWVMVKSNYTWHIFSQWWISVTSMKRNPPSERKFWCRSDFIFPFFSKVMSRWPKKYGSRSKLVIHDTPSLSGEYLYLMKRIHPVEGWMDGQTDGQTDRRTYGLMNKEPIYPLSPWLVGSMIKLGGKIYCLYIVSDHGPKWILVPTDGWQNNWI